MLNDNSALVLLGQYIIYYIFKYTTNYKLKPTSHVYNISFYTMQYAQKDKEMHIRKLSVFSWRFENY